jgi:Tol biopolymer transport system component
MHRLPPLLLFSTMLMLLSGCGGKRVVTFPFDAGGRGLNSPHNEGQPQISGRFLVFISDRRGSQDIELFDMQARQLVPLPGLNRLDMMAHEAAVSEDGRLIVFTASQEGRSGIYLYLRDSQQVRPLVMGLRGEVRNPTISERGDRIAFQVSFNGQWDVAVYDRNGQPINVPTNPRL